MIENEPLRALYCRLLSLYPPAFKAQFEDSMKQTFADVYHDQQRQARLNRVAFMTWYFAKTVAGLVRAYLDRLTEKDTQMVRRYGMDVRCASVLVDDQDKALQFYPEKLGFVLKKDMPDGDSPMCWLTVAALDGMGMELELQTVIFDSQRAYQKDFFDNEYAFIGLQTVDIQADYQRLKSKGVVFHGEPEDTGPVYTVKFEDTCGNLINLIQSKM